VLVWIVTMAGVARSAWRQGPSNLASDLSRYGRNAQWKGVYYRGEKIGFFVGQSKPLDDGFELEEEGQLRLLLMGSSSVAKVRTLARVDRAFNLRSFSFALDPGTGPISIDGRLEGRTLHLDIGSPTGGRRSETRELGETPALSLNLPRQLAAAGLKPGTRLSVSTFDPATLSNAPMTIDVQKREVIWSQGRPVPATRIEMQFSGVTSRSWVTDVGEVVREESPMGLIVVRETRARAVAMAVPGDVQDMLQAASITPSGKRVDDPSLLVSLKLRIEGPALDSPDLQGAGQSVEGRDVTIVRADTLAPTATDDDLARYLRPEALIESDAPEIVAEAQRALGQLRTPQERTERLVRHVSALIEKKPTVSLPSAREVLRTRVGDCNEHTALFVALARAAGLPARVAVGLVYLHGAFYYHAWPEVYLTQPGGRGHWIPVDPTLNQYPADVTHVRLARGGLERQTAILPLLGRTKIQVLNVEARADAPPLVVGEARPGTSTFVLPRREEGTTCWTAPRR
jgi:hypothetical protein